MVKDTRQPNIENLFRARAESYDSTEWVTNAEVLNAHFSVIPNSTSRIVDVGTGTGVLGSYLQTRGRNITGIDISEAMLAQASLRLTDLVRGASMALPFSDESFDGAFLRQVLHYLDEVDRRVSICEAYRVCRYGGVVVVSQTTPYSNEDKDYWDKIKRIRQPLRQWSPTASEIVDLLKTQPFATISIHSIEHEERLHRWIERNPSRSESIGDLIDYYKNAPGPYKGLHVLSVKDDDVVIREIWSIVVAFK